jgi:hypothetical protein
MPAVLVESKSEVLEDAPESLLPDPELLEGEQFSSLDEKEEKEVKVAAEKPVKETVKETVAVEDDVPDEFKGKTQAQLAKMYRDAQTLIGRQGAELGEVRKLADRAIQANLAALKQKEQPKETLKELEETDFFAQPKEAIARAIAESPVIKELAAKFGHIEKEKAVDRATSNTQRFNQAHPDASEIMQDPDFQKWVEASKVRMGLLQRAHTRFDFEAGDEVFGTWKALRGTKKAAVEAADEQSDEQKAAEAARFLASRKKKLQDAKTPTGGNAAPTAGQPGAKKIYRRADVLKLMEEQPERYEALAPEIELAYREGRVR